MGKTAGKTARVAAIQNDGDFPSFSETYLGEDGIEFTVCDVGNDIIVRVRRASVRRAECLNTAEVIGCYEVARAMFTCVTRAVSRKVNDDVIALLDLGVVGKTQKRVNDVSTGWDECIGIGGGTEEALYVMFRDLEVVD